MNCSVMHFRAFPYVLTCVAIVSLYRYCSIGFIRCYRERVVQFNNSNEVYFIGIFSMVTYTCIFYVAIYDSDLYGADCWSLS
jgi:hypothetical protein